MFASLSDIIICFLKLYFLDWHQ